MLGTRIAALRRRAGISQKELARRLNVSTSAIGMYEQGRREPGADRLVEMAALFGVSTDYLLTGVPAEPCDEGALRHVLGDAAGHFGGRLLLEKPDGSLLPMARDDLITLLSALLGD